MLIPLPIKEVAVDIEPPPGPLKRVDHPVPISVEFLKMLMQEITRLRVRRSPCAMVPARIIAAGMHQ